MHLRSNLPLALAASLIPLSAAATVVIALTVEEMTQRSALVVRATTGPSQASYSADQGSIWTYTELKVAETLKGPAGQTVLVKQPGGIVGPVGQMVAGAARFKEHEDVVLFLDPAVDEKGVYVVMGLAAGKVGLEDRLGVSTAVRHLEGIAFAAPGSRTIRAVGDLEELGTTEAFLKRVRTAAKGGRR